MGPKGIEAEPPIPRPVETVVMEILGYGDSVDHTMSMNGLEFKRGTFLDGYGDAPHMAAKRAETQALLEEFADMHAQGEFGADYTALKDYIGSYFKVMFGEPQS